jgi:hypothetical protein
MIMMHASTIILARRPLESKNALCGNLGYLMEIRPAVRTADASELPLPTKCPLTAALNAIGGKWSLICHSNLPD